MCVDAVDADANQIIQFGRCLISVNGNIFCHLKNKIALTIPALNE